MKSMVSNAILVALVQLTWTTLGLSEQTKSRLEVEQDILKSIFLTNEFFGYVRPEPLNQTTDQPLEVYVSLYLLRSDIDIESQECNIQMYFRQEWNESRLLYDDQGKVDVISIHKTVGFWTPDLFFVNEKSGQLHTLTKPNTFVRIYPEGRILYSQRISLKLSCPVDLRKYPFDTQICKLAIESYGYTAKDLMLRWKPDTVFGMNDPSDYSLTFSAVEEIVHVGENDYSRLELRIHFTRLVYKILLHLYFPLTLLTVLSWTSFWMKPYACLPRLTFAVLLSFTVLTLLQSARKFFHPRGYLTALDVWIGTSCMFIFGTVAINFYVVAAHSERIINETKDSKKAGELQKGDQKLTEMFTKKFLSEGSNVDKIGRLIFPSLYALFNVIYLAYYLV